MSVVEFLNYVAFSKELNRVEEQERKQKRAI